MNSANNLDYLEEKYINIARNLIKSSKSRKMALCDEMSTELMYHLVPGHDFRNVPINCLEDFKVLLSEFKFISNQLDEERDRLIKLTPSQKDYINRSTTQRSIIALKSYSGRRAIKIITSIMNIAFELYRLRHLPLDQKEKIDYVSIEE